MGLAEDLKTLQDLHDRGQLTDAEYAAAKAATLKKEVPPSAGFRFGRFIGGRLILLLALLGVLLAFLWYRAGTRNTTQMIATAVHAPITVTDEVQNLPANSWKAIPFALTYGGTLDINLQVIRGNPIDVFLTTIDQLDTMQKGEWNNVRVFGYFNAVKTKTYRRTGQLGKGSYYLVLRDTSLGILSSPATDVSVKVELNP